MDLWNEYEGRSINGIFPLERLIRPEGRSAFFSTNDGGTSTVIRLIESHFDEDEILARWSGVSDLHQPNLLTLSRFGQAMMDETSLVYVVLEPTEADLSQILAERPLTPVETRQVADSLIPALQALHRKGFIHEHIQPVNVLAVGEVVKLRSDCIREAPEGADGAALRSRDIHDVATVLLQCLTQQSSLPAGLPLPAPFNEIVENGVSGSWNLDQMATALAAGAPRSVEPPTVAPLPGSEPASIRDLHRRPELEPLPVAVPLQSVTPAEERISPTAAHPFPEAASGRIRVPMVPRPGRSQRGLALVVLAVVCVGILAAYALSHRNSDKAVATGIPSPDAGQTVSGQVPPPAAQIAPNAVSAKAPETRPALPSSRTQWRVVAFTYNQRDQAAAKARVLERQFASLHPAVFTPTGHAPYLVTLGGALSRDAAFALKSRLRRSSLPRDLYAQNYSGTHGLSE